MSTTDQKNIGKAIGRVAAGIYIVTAKQGEKCTGLLASWVQQASFQPPLISMAIKVGRPIQTLLDAGAPFVVNVIGKGQRKYVTHFAKGFSLDEPAFEGLRTTEGVTGSPILDDVVAYMECRVHSKTKAGDHMLYFGEVVAGELISTHQPEIRFRESGFTY